MNNVVRLFSAPPFPVSEVYGASRLVSFAQRVANKCGRQELIDFSTRAAFASVVLKRERLDIRPTAELLALGKTVGVEYDPWTSLKEG